MALQLTPTPESSELKRQNAAQWAAAIDLIIQDDRARTLQVKTREEELATEFAQAKKIEDKTAREKAIQELNDTVNQKKDTPQETKSKDALPDEKTLLEKLYAEVDKIITAAKSEAHETIKKEFGDDAELHAIVDVTFQPGVLEDASNLYRGIDDLTEENNYHGLPDQSHHHCRSDIITLLEDLRKARANNEDETATSTAAHIVFLSRFASAAQVQRSEIKDASGFQAYDDKIAASMIGLKNIFKNAADHVAGATKECALACTPKPGASKTKDEEQEYTAKADGKVTNVFGAEPDRTAVAQVDIRSKR